MHCRLLTQYAIIMVQFLAGLRKIKLPAGYTSTTFFVCLVAFKVSLLLINTSKLLVNQERTHIEMNKVFRYLRDMHDADTLVQTGGEGGGNHLERCYWYVGG